MLKWVFSWIDRRSVSENARCLKKKTTKNIILNVFLRCWKASWNALSMIARSSLVALSRISCVVWKQRPFGAVLSLRNRNSLVSRVRRIVWPGHKGCLMCQITADEERHVSRDEERHVSRGSVVGQHPSLVFSQFRALPVQHSSNELKLPNKTKKVCLHLITWYKRIAVNAFACIFSIVKPFPHPLWRLHLGLNIIVKNPCLVSYYVLL